MLYFFCIRKASPGTGFAGYYIESFAQVKRYVADGGKVIYCYEINHNYYAVLFRSVLFFPGNNLVKLFDDGWDVAYVVYNYQHGIVSCH